jgi:serine/threonine protein kinase
MEVPLNFTANSQLMGSDKGKRLGRYEIVAEIGRGAMGVVYQARDPKIDRFVALKTISLAGQDPDEEQEYRERFFVEAQAAGRLLHPGIVTIFDVGEEPERRNPYIVMEYIAGQSLSKLLSGEKKKIPFRTALRLTEELAEALDYAHAQGVVHRDIKPANILITEEGHAKIADFGIAKLNLARLTVPGQVLGTPAYMSPEQLEGEQVDGRSDLFSLGVILYSMITGFKPFQGNSATTVCFKVANREPVPATALDSELPPELDAVLSRAMAKDRAQRYQRGMDFALDVHELRLHMSQTQTSTWIPSFTATGTGSRSHSTESRTPQPVNRMTPLRGVAAIRHAYALLRDKIRRTAPKLVFGLAIPKLVLGLAILIVGLDFLSFVRRVSSAGTTADPPTVVKATPRASQSKNTSVNRAASGHVSSNVSGLASNSAPSANKNSGASGTFRTTQARNPDKNISARAAGSSSNLKLSIEHHFSDATVSLFVDGKLFYTHALHGQSKKHLGVFGGSIQGYDTQIVRVPPGDHRLRVHVESSQDAYDRSTTILATFTPGRERTLRVNFEKQRKNMMVDLE